MELRFAEAATPDDASIEVGRMLFAGETTFVKGVVAMDGLPPADRIEVCFAGRSNVGKSSLINALTGRKGLARAVLAQAETAVQTLGAAVIFLEVAEDNDAARALYAQAGYAQIGRRPGYYLPKDAAPVAALVLRKAVVAK